jgi:hypothetical protein
MTMTRLGIFINLFTTVLAAHVSSFLKVDKEKPLTGKAIEERSGGSLVRNLENKVGDDRQELSSFLKVVKDKPLSEEAFDIINKRRAQERLERNLSDRHEVSSFLKVVKDKPLTGEVRDSLPLDTGRNVGTTKSFAEREDAKGALVSKEHVIEFSDKNRRLDFDGLNCNPLDDNELVCYGDDIPNGGFVTVFVCPASALSLEDCLEACYIFQVDEADQITTGTPTCNECGVCTGADASSQMSFDCSNLSADPCAVQDCTGSDCLLLAPGAPGEPNSGGASDQTKTDLLLMSVVGAGVALLLVG